MTMEQGKKTTLKNAISGSLRRKFNSYNPKTIMPFHTRLLGKDRMALFSFIQSLNTTFGSVIYEPAAKALAEGNFDEIVLSKKSNGLISAGAQNVINEIKNGLERSVIDPNQEEEVEKIRKVCRKGEAVNINLRRADIYLVRKNKHYPIDIKTAKPNIDGFEKYKENILKWTAAILYENPKTEVGAMLAIPYNPDYPEPYKHWTMRGMIENGTQIKVAENFWDFLAGEKVYDDLLDCFEEVGVEMRQEIDEYFSRFHAN